MITVFRCHQCRAQLLNVEKASFRQLPNEAGAKWTIDSRTEQPPPSIPTKETHSGRAPLATALRVRYLISAPPCFESTQSWGKTTCRCDQTGEAILGQVRMLLEFPVEI